MTTFLSFYLPQYHPIPENDEWWGKGFTDWTNVALARPRFRTHYQPHIPADLGFYDLRLAETRISQAKMASSYGIGGFCYYHYWFNGQLLLQCPLAEVLKDGKPDLPFCMCWANENWTRAWDGLDRQVLIRQTYTDEDLNQHFAFLKEYFRDSRYIRVEGSPIFIIYRPDHIPGLSDYLAKFRKLALRAGFPGLFLCATTNGFTTLSEEALLSSGFDAVIDFQPNRKDFPRESSWSHQIVKGARTLLPASMYQAVKHNSSMVNRVDYHKLVSLKISQRWPSGYLRYPCIFPSWDNTARRKTPTVIQNTSPEDYGRWLQSAAEVVSSYPADRRLVFINAWNEWAEGCHLEPDRNLGTAFLEATRKVIFAINGSS